MSSATAARILVSHSVGCIPWRGTSRSHRSLRTVRRAIWILVVREAPRYTCNHPA
ncbi:uncharacterized protein TRAVEDRAFT_38826 [Trametes versicolor FP-101664 SS1]|uniref:uncharacterized protein n=1 Tax=Trametes versicolor (strain FP-101664) TaxID=717944 RepID=UPI0004621F4E|nr:uncharacterized protein TRAVEDRAFT_38826 [Trametes versicolor FP-101664 SS1]EIW55607.1 hypothetical protein TRAVEDRAFT_38826 [Trametes versicolor FP-101664 SS1]